MSRNIRIVIPAEDAPGSSQMDSSIRIACCRMPFPPHRRVCAIRFAVRQRIHFTSKPLHRHGRKGRQLDRDRDRRLRFAHGEPGAKKTLAGVAAGTGIAVLATNVLSWLWGI